MPNSMKTHCKVGHELTPENIYIRKGKGWSPECRTCRTLARTRYTLPDPQMIAARMRDLPSHCWKGHKLSDGNVSITKGGIATCLTCDRGRRKRSIHNRRITAQEVRIIVRRLKGGETLTNIMRGERGHQYVRGLKIKGLTPYSIHRLEVERPLLYAMMKRLAEGSIAAERSVCLRGHPLTEENILVWGGSRRCRTCSLMLRHSPQLKEEVVRTVLFRLHEGATYENIGGRENGHYVGNRSVTTTRLKAFRQKHPKLGKVMDSLAEKNRVAARSERAAKRLVGSNNTKLDEKALPIINEATQNLPQEIRENIRSLMAIAVRERRLKLKDIPARVREFRSLYRKQNKHSLFDEYSANDSLDRQKFDDGPTTLGDTITHGLWN